MGKPFTVEEAQKVIDRLRKFDGTAEASNALYRFVEKESRVSRARISLELFFSADVETPEDKLSEVTRLLQGLGSALGDIDAFEGLLEVLTEGIRLQTASVSGDAMTEEEIAAVTANDVLAAVGFPHDCGPLPDLCSCRVKQ